MLVALNKDYEFGNGKGYYYKAKGQA